jgi:hypothetical protein
MLSDFDATNPARLSCQDGNASFGGAEAKRTRAFEDPNAPPKQLGKWAVALAAPPRTSSLLVINYQSCTASFLHLDCDAIREESHLFAPSERLFSLHQPTSQSSQINLPVRYTSISTPSNSHIRPVDTYNTRTACPHTEKGSASCLQTIEPCEHNPGLFLARPTTQHGFGAESLRSKQLPSQQPFQNRQATLDSVTSRTNSPSIAGLNSPSARFPCQYISELFIFKQILCRPHGSRENNQLHDCNELGQAQ